MTDISKVIMLGTGSVVPNSSRVGIGTLLVVSGKTYLFDCGPGVSYRFAQTGREAKDLAGVYISHTHLDHIVDLPLIIFWAFWNGRQKPFEIYGPVGTEKHIKLLFQDLFAYVPNLLRERGKQFSLNIHETSGSVLLEQAVKIEAFKVEHGVIPSLGYRIDTQEGSLGISGDTAPCDLLLEKLRGVDTLIHECAFPDSFGEHPLHTIPRQLGPIAKTISPKVLVMNHFFPMCEAEKSNMLASVALEFKGKVVFAADMDEFPLA